MRRPGLGTWMAASNLGLVLLAVAGVAYAAVRTLDRLAAAEATARVELAAAEAEERLARLGGALRTDAALLAERPTLGRLLAAGDRDGASAFVERFVATGGLDAAAILAAEEPALHAGRPLPWAELPAGELAALPSGDLVLTASSPLAGDPRIRVAVAALVDDRRLAPAAGSRAAIAVRPGAAAALGAGWLDGAALAGRAAAGRAPDGSAFAAVRPLYGGGRVVGVLAATAPAARRDEPLGGFVRGLLRVTVALALLAAAGSLLAGRRLARPLRELTTAAARIGAGDLSAPVAARAGAEVATLAAAMEDMRRRLLALLADLRRERGESEAVLERIADGVFTVDADRRVRYLNDQAARLLEIDPQAAIGRFCGDLLQPVGENGVRPCDDACPIVHARFRGAARSTETLALPSGRRTLIVSSAPAVEGQQVQVLRDETGVEAGRRVRDAVLANISHEFKTPLAAQLASIELLRDRLAAGPDAEARELARALERGTLRLAQLVDNLLESVHVEAGRGSLRRAPVELAEVVAAAVELTRPLLEQRRQALRLELPPALPAVSGDAPRLTQVLVNLLANANKFAPAGSTIAVGAAVDGAELLVWVDDEGPGLPPGSGRELFARFVRGDVDGSPGMGLGLAIVESIVQRHGGRVEAAPRDPGTRMRVALPLHAH